MPEMNVLIKPSSSMCNLRCKYCFYMDESNNRTTKSYGFMNDTTIENIIKKTIEHSDIRCTFSFQGGEPMLVGIDFFRKVIMFQEKYNKKKVIIQNSIQTNGTLIDTEWIRFFKENEFLVGVSLDGISYTHDMYRKGQNGEATHDLVLKNILKLVDVNVPCNILTVVNARTAKSITKIYEFYRQKNFTYLQFIPCLNPIGEEKIRFSYTLTAKDYSLFLRTLFDLWYKDLINNRIVHIQEFENYVGMLLNKMPTICGMSGVCSCQYVIEANGEVYPCDFYVLDEYCLGNLNQIDFNLIDQKRKEINFVEKSMVLNNECEKCKFNLICRGGCRRHREPITKMVPSKNQFCIAYYEFFKYAKDRIEELARIYG